MKNRAGRGRVIPRLNFVSFRQALARSQSAPRDFARRNSSRRWALRQTRVGRAAAQLLMREAKCRGRNFAEECVASRASPRYEDRPLRRWPRFARIWLYRPLPIFVSRYQVGVYGRFLPRPNPLLVLPIGLPEAVCGRPPLNAPPPPRAVFASNPMRDLKWLLGV